MDETRRQVLERRIELPRIGEVRQADPPTGAPFSVVINGTDVEPITAYLTDLVLSDMSPLTIKSYAHDLLRRWKLLAAVDVAWHQASRAEVELAHARNSRTPRATATRTSRRCSVPATERERVVRPQDHQYRLPAPKFTRPAVIATPPEPRSLHRYGDLTDTPIRDHLHDRCTGVADASQPSTHP